MGYPSNETLLYLQNQLMSSPLSISPIGIVSPTQANDVPGSNANASNLENLNALLSSKDDNAHIRLLGSENYWSDKHGI